MIPILVAMSSSRVEAACRSRDRPMISLLRVSYGGAAPSEHIVCWSLRERDGERSNGDRARTASRWMTVPAPSHGVGVDPVLLELLPERVAVDPEELRRAHLVPLGLPHHGPEQRLLDQPQHETVQIGGRAAPQP